MIWGVWGCQSCHSHRKPDIPVPYLYVDMGVAVLCASFMSFGVKRRWFALGAALQLAVATYAAHVGGHVHYGDWLKVRMYSRTIAIIGGFLILASGAGELYRQKPRSRSLQSTGQVFLGIYLICQVRGQLGTAGDTQGVWPSLQCCTAGWGCNSLGVPSATTATAATTLLSLGEKP
ncbi:transmembrane protein 101 [Malurus melanocephalus]|uniref:transmembrane protein 101 n=1 Tax=Malurus melanocephalus TaxID=175006 RepID=UPI00254850CE|nr:transmembrane protein 101 [Malurus melanocephalus]